DPADEGEFVLLAVPHVDTEVRHVGLADLRQAPRAAQPGLVRAIDRWIEAVSAGLAHWVAPAPIIHHALQPGATISVAGNTRVGGGSEVAWLDIPRDAALFLSTQELPAGPGTCTVPLS